MRYALNLSEDGRILSATFEKYAAEGMPLVDALPTGDIYEYIHKNGEYIHDPIPKPEKVKGATTDEVLNALLGIEENEVTENE